MVNSRDTDQTAGSVDLSLHDLLGLISPNTLRKYGVSGLCAKTTSFMVEKEREREGRRVIILKWNFRDRFLNIEFLKNAPPLF